MSDIEKAARDIKALNEQIYVPRHDYRPVDPRSFRHLDLEYYDRTRDAFVLQGCTWLADLENVTLKNTPQDLRTFIRVMTSRDRTTCVGLYHPKPKFWIRLLLWIFRARMGKVIDCESELSTGGFIVTSNAMAAGKLNSPPGFDMKYFPIKTSPDTVFQTHLQRLKTIMAANPGIFAIPIRTAEEALEMQHRMEAAKSAFRQSIGYVTEDELQRLGTDSNTASQIKQAMDRTDKRL